MDWAVIFGHAGQDGSLLTAQLESDGLAVLGIGRREVRSSVPLPDWANAVDPFDAAAVETAIRRLQPREIYFLAGVHRPAERAADDFGATLEACYATHVRAYVHVLEAMDRSSRDSRLFYAASSQVFGVGGDAPQDESTPFRPICPYGLTKALGIEIGRCFRREKRLHVSGGILYNHESSLRKPGFVSRRIVAGACDVRDGTSQELRLGNLQARVDWGHAPDYVEAMRRIVRADQPDDYVVATGESHTVQEFVEIAFAALGLDWRRHVVEDPVLLTQPPRILVGDSRRLRTRTGWRPTLTFAEMIQRLVEERRHRSR